MRFEDAGSGVVGDRAGVFPGMQDRRSLLAAQTWPCDFDLQHFLKRQSVLSLTFLA